jgi:hypothetical protein
VFSLVSREKQKGDRKLHNALSMDKVVTFHKYQVAVPAEIPPIPRE